MKLIKYNEVMNNKLKLCLLCILLESDNVNLFLKFYKEILFMLKE